MSDHQVALLAEWPIVLACVKISFIFYLLGDEEGFVVTEHFLEKNLEIQIEKEHLSLRLRWLGAAEANEKSGAVRQFLYTMKEQAVADGKKIILDFSHLDYMNTSFIGMVTNFVLAISDEKAQVEVVMDTKVNWQRFSYRAFATIFSQTDNVSVLDSSSTRPSIRSGK